MRIAIVGAGWYGCHIAKALLDVQADVTVFEKEDGIFRGASYNNQSRLHLGFHYPRCSYTRDESITSYNLFMGKYSGFTRHVTNNIYAIAEDKSLIDWMTYRDIMMALRITGLKILAGRCWWVSVLLISIRLVSILKRYFGEILKQVSA